VIYLQTIIKVERIRPNDLVLQLNLLPDLMNWLVVAGTETKKAKLISQAKLLVKTCEGCKKQFKNQKGLLMHELKCQQFLLLHPPPIDPVASMKKLDEIVLIEEDAKALAKPRREPRGGTMQNCKRRY
jgi:hypothetical protein